MKNKRKYTLIKCENCNKEFECQNFRIEKHKHLFCCKKCEGEYRRNHSTLNCQCEICGKWFHRKQSQINKNIHNVCSKECNKQLRKTIMLGEGNHQYGLKGSDNASWKSDDKISTYGYKLIRDANHPFKNCNDFVFEHRLIAEKYLLTNETSIIINGKKYLSNKYIVHHIDFNKLNNDLNNLKIMKRDEHTKFHVFYKLYKNNNLNYYQELNDIIAKYNLPYNITDDDETDGVRNGGFGSTGK